MSLRTQGRNLRLTLTKKDDNRKNCESSFNINHWNCFFFILQTFCFVQNLLNMEKG